MSNSNNKEEMSIQERRRMTLKCILALSDPKEKRETRVAAAKVLFACVNAFYSRLASDLEPLAHAKRIP